MSIKLPEFFESDGDGGMYFSLGDRIYGTLTQRGSFVEYRFNDGSGTNTETIDFGTEAKAIAAATQMAMAMRVSAPNVPTLTNFRILFLAMPIL